MAKASLCGGDGPSDIGSAVQRHTRTRTHAHTRTRTQRHPHVCTCRKTPHVRPHTHTHTRLLRAQVRRPRRHDHRLQSRRRHLPTLTSSFQSTPLCQSTARFTTWQSTQISHTPSTLGSTVAIKWHSSISHSSCPLHGHLACSRRFPRSLADLSRPTAASTSSCRLAPTTSACANRRRCNLCRCHT
jgi:hypothetical protein